MVCCDVIVSYRIVQLHEGTLSVHSEGEGTGTTFTLTLPIHPHPPSEADSNPDVSSGMNQTMARRSPTTRRMRIDPTDSVDMFAPDYSMHRHPSRPSFYRSGFPQVRLLLVDDALLNRKMLRRLLDRDQFAFSEAADGVQAVKAVADSMANDTPIDLVLMDYQMPNMDGPTAASRMRAMGYKGPIIGITGNALESDISEFMSKGANKVLTKPVDLTMLENAFAGIEF